MHCLVATVPTLAISTIYCLWFACRQLVYRQHRQKSERVTYMLWVMANEMKEHAPMER